MNWMILGPLPHLQKVWVHMLYSIIQRTYVINHHLVISTWHILNLEVVRSVSKWGGSLNWYYLSSLLSLYLDIDLRLILRFWSWWSLVLEVFPATINGEISCRYPWILSSFVNLDIFVHHDFLLLLLFLVHHLRFEFLLLLTATSTGGSIFSFSMI